MNKIFILLLSMGVSMVSIASTTKTDSLKYILQQTKDNQKRAILYTTIAKSYEHTNIDSAMYYAYKGVAVSQMDNYILGLAENYAALGDFFVIKNDLEKAKTNYTLASNLFLKANKMHSYTQLLMILGNIHLTQNDYVEALKMYLKSLDLSKKNDFNDLTPNLYNNLGVLYLQIEDYGEANQYFKKAYRLFLKLGMKNHVAMVLTNISQINAAQDNNKEAIQGYQEANKIFYKHNLWENIASSYNSISEIYYKIKQYEKAEEYLNLALKTIPLENKKYSGPSSVTNVKIYTNASKLFYQKKDYEKAIEFAKKSLQLSYSNSFKQNIYQNAKILSAIYNQQNQFDSAYAYFKIFVDYYEKFQNEHDLKRITQIKMQHSFDMVINQKEKEQIIFKAHEKRKELIYLIIIVSVLLIGIIASLLYFNQKNINAKTLLLKENLKLEKTQLENELKYKNKELVTNMMYLLEKNEFITSIAKKLRDIQMNSKKSNQDIIRQLVDELKKNSSTKIWEEFEVRFKEVHTEFYQKLSKEFPDLTPNEIKICAFLRLNMSTKEISAITHQSVKSINMARFRLRKRLNIDRDENLIRYLSNL